MKINVGPLLENGVVEVDHLFVKKWGWGKLIIKVCPSKVCPLFGIYLNTKD